MADNIQSFSDHTSSLVRTVQYNVDTRTLSVQLNSGGVYSYQNVPLVVFYDFRRAASRGRYYNMYVKPVYGASQEARLTYPLMTSAHPSAVVYDMRNPRYDSLRGRSAWDVYLTKCQRAGLIFAEAARKIREANNKKLQSTLKKGR